MKKSNLEIIQNLLSDSFDVKYRKLETQLGAVCLIFVDSICDTTFISDFIIAPLVSSVKSKRNIEFIQNQLLTSATVEEAQNPEQAVSLILSGNVVLLFDFTNQMLYCGVKKFANRAIETPPTETVIQGSREGFTENVAENMSLVRKRLNNADLKCESILVGKKSNTQVILVYLKESAPKKLVSYVRRKLKESTIDLVLYNSQVIEPIAAKKTAFETVAYTEKPDVFVSKITEGRVGLLVGGTPFAVTVPHFFFEGFQTADDYTRNKYTANFIRLIRWTAFGITLLLPGVYIALTTHHFSLIPEIFAFRLSVSRAGVPYPAVVEILIMLYFFQLLREAGVRLPQPIGQAISIVGALILGDAAINAGLASAPNVLLVALTSISSFLIPTIYYGLSLWTTFIIICAALLGLPGYFVGFIVFVSHLAGLQSCGYPFLYPLGTLTTFGHKDRILRDDLKEISNNFLSKDEKL